MVLRLFRISALLALTTAAATAQPLPPTATLAPVVPEPAYATLVGLAIGAPVVVDATIRSAARIKPAEAAGLLPGKQRYYVEADATALLKGPDGIPSRLGWLVDVSPDARGRWPQLKKQRVLAFARPTPANLGQLQLVAPNAQMAWSPSLDGRVRAIVRDLLLPDAPPAITGVGNAFHVAGSLPGESETQIFLQTANGRPVSLSILRRPGEAPRWAVALSEIVDDSAAVPARDSLLWYRLACGLPPRLPDGATASLSPADAAAAQADYRVVQDALGPCERG